MLDTGYWMDTIQRRASSNQHREVPPWQDERSELSGKVKLLAIYPFCQSKVENLLKNRLKNAY
jgi:hypothetical protein